MLYLIGTNGIQKECWLRVWNFRVLGAKAPLQNSADLRAKGWEISLDWNDRIGNVQYYLGFNLYDSRTKITKYDNEVGLLGKDSDDNLIYRKGMELGEIWGYTTDRLYTTEDFDSQGKLKNNIPKVEGYNPNPEIYFMWILMGMVS